MKLKLLYFGNLLAQKGLTPSTIDTLSVDLRQSGYEVIAASDRMHIFYRMLDMMGCFFKNQKPTDYVLIDTYSTLNFYYALTLSLLCRLFQKKYVLLLHGGNLPQRLDRHPRLCKMVFDHAYINVAPSRYLLEAFESRGIKNIQFIPNSIDLSLYPVISKTYDSPRILWVRAFATIYHPEMALAVLETVLKSYPEATLTMVGPEKDGSLAKMQQLAQEKQLPICFTGKLSKSEWIALSAQHNVFINTTDFDNTPVSIMEAMALGFPIVSTNVGGLPYMIDNGQDGLLVDAGAVSAMSQCICRIMTEDKLRNSLIDQAILKSLQWDVRQVQQKWQEVLV